MKHKLYRIKDHLRPNQQVFFDNKYKTQQEDNYEAANLNIILGELAKSVAALAKKNIQQMNLNKSHFQIEVRDREVIIQLPQINKNISIEKTLKTWSTKMVKTVFSSAFHYFFQKKMSFEQAKVFCSQNILKNIVELSKKITLGKSQFEIIDRHLQFSILNYMATKYPLTDSQEVNKKLEEVVHEIDDIEALKNNYFFNSDIDFEYRENGNYNDLIMRVINDLSKRINSESSLTQQKSNYHDFQQFMTVLFKKVEDENWMKRPILDRIYSQSVLSEKQIIKNKNENLYENQQKLRKQLIEKQNYKVLVRQYTSFLIGRKIPQNLKLYTQKEIQNMNIKIRSPTILRILTKWCEELWEKFASPNYFSDRSQNIKIIKTGKINSLILWMRQSIDSQLANQKILIEKFREQIIHNNYLMQSNILYRQLEIDDDDYVQQNQKISGKFSQKVVNNLHSYIITYLNRLIHGLVKVSKLFYEKNNISRFSNWKYPPNLLSLKLGDLIRCKFTSHQKQVLRIFKQIEKISNQQPQKLKIVRIKNRLKKETNDILINARFNNYLLCQIQLGVKAKTSDFIKCSNQYAHYLYELQRSIFGPLTQLCSIWRSFDRRTDIYQQLIDQEEVSKNSLQHSCEENRKKYTLQPFKKSFICSQCKLTYFHSNFLINHLKCSNQCNYIVCAKCLLRKQSFSNLKQNFIKDEKIRNRCIRLAKSYENFPKFGVCFQIESRIVKSSIFMFFKYKSKPYLLQRQNNIISEVEDISTTKKMKIFFNKYIVFQLENQNNQFLNISQIEAINTYFLPKIMKNVFKKQKESISIMNFNLKSNECKMVVNIGTKSQRQIVKSAILTENKISNVQFIAEAFPNLQWLQLSRNPLKEFNGLENLIKLKSLIIANCDLTQLPPQIFQILPLQYLKCTANNIRIIPKDISKLKQLKVFEANRIGLKIIPNQLFQCSKINLINFSQNKIGVLPTQIDKLKYLEQLIIDRNSIHSLPDSVCKNLNLTEINISSNLLNQLPNQIGNLTKLKFLSCEKNSISILPQSIVKLTSLESLNISKNKIQTLPDKIQELRLLTKLQISDNPIKMIPNAIFKMAKIQILDLSNCQISQIPETIEYLKNLNILKMNNNRLTLIPDKLKQLKLLEIIEVANNQIVVIPELLLNKLEFLQKIDISYNKITDCPNISNCLQLKHLNISNNCIQNLKNEYFLNLPVLMHFSCAKNKLNQIPSAIKSLKKLKILDLSFNSIQSSSDKNYNSQSLPQIQEIDLSNNQLHQIPNFIFTSKNIQKLNFANNKITLINSQISSLTEIKELNLSQNKISQIPSSIKAMLKLKKINLSKNNISIVPQQVEQLKNLEQIQLAQNPIKMVLCPKISSKLKQ